MLPKENPQRASRATTEGGSRTITTPANINTAADRRELAALEMLRIRFRLRVARRQDFAGLLAEIYLMARRLEASGLEVTQ
jgi:hypothetical protein